MSRERRAHGDGDGGAGCGGNAAPYVLGALTESESTDFVDHLAECAVCREEVAALRTVAAALPAAAPQFAAPPELKTRIFAEVHADARAHSEKTGRSRARRRAADDGRPARSGGFAGRPLDGSRRRLGLLVPAGAGAALAAVVAVVLVLALGGSGGWGGSPVRVVRAQVSTPGGAATVHIAGARGELRMANMPQVRTGRVYQVWVRRGGAPLPTDALFTVSSNGSATVEIPGGVRGVREVMVSSEPLGGSRAPTRAPVLVARLS